MFRPITPFNFRGAEPPEQVLCRSTVDHNYYKVFNHLTDVDPAAFQPTGRHFGGVFPSRPGSDS